MAQQYEYARFNSTTVQLIRNLSKFKPVDLIEFQFHNGTINTQQKTTKNVTKKWFQFHNGTINTRTDQRCRNGNTMFQFHNGTINTSRKT